MVQRPILTVTLNPALDVAAQIDRVIPGPKLRLDAPRQDPGGGGVNVARAVHMLGGVAEAFAVLGGPTGARIAQLLETEGVTLHAFDIAQDSRQSLSISERSTGRQFRFVLPGAAWSPDRSDAVLGRLAELAVPDALVVLSGSQPPGASLGFAHRLNAQLGVGGRLVLDTSGPALAQVLGFAAQPPLSVLRLDQAEAEAAAGHPLGSVADSADFAHSLVARGVATMVVLARGAEGNVLADQTQRLHCRPPMVSVDSPVGAGDSFTAGFTLALARGQDPAAALHAGTAAAAAAVMTSGTELCRSDDVARISAQCRIDRL